MAVFLKDFGVIKNELQTDISVSLPQASQAKNSAITDLFVNPNASQLSFLHRSIQQVLNATELNIVAGVDLERFASNYGLRRKPGTSAQGSVLLVLDESFDQNQDIEVPTGQIVSATGANGQVSFRTTLSLFLRREDREVYAAIAEGARDQLRQAGITNVKYAVEVPIVSTVAGGRGIVGTYSINQGQIRGVREVINLVPTTGGFEAETDTALRRRVALVIAGNSVGTVDGVRKAALGVTGVNSAFVVTPGSPLMTRDGTVFDPDGNLLQSGRGNTIDVYIFGQILTDTTIRYVFQQDTRNPDNLSLAESIILGLPGATDKQQPVVAIGAISGLESGTNFQIAREIEDEDGNIVLEGHVALVKDFEASSYSLVRNTATNDLALARSLNPNSAKYALVEQLQSSPNANSIRGEDRLVFLRKFAVIENEIIARGSELNGADSLTYQDVTKIMDIEEDVKIERELVRVSTDGAFQIRTRHSPIVSISQVKHVRLGTVFNAQISDRNRGLINLSGRFAPQIGDYVEVSYVWRKRYLPGFEYFLQEDSVNWIQDDFKLESDSLTLYNNDLEPEISPALQPLTPTYLSIGLSNTTKRALYEIEITGDIADAYRAFLVNYQAGASSLNPGYTFNAQVFAREDAIDAHIGRVTRVRNVTRGFDYNLIGYSLRANRFAPEANLDPDLQAVQFVLDEQVNLTTINIGDYVRFNAPRKNANWSAVEEFQNNIRGNIQPIFDDTKIEIEEEAGEIRLLQPERNENLPETVAPAQIDEDTTWSGKVRVDGDIIVTRNTTLTILPGTVIAVVGSGDLPTASEVIQKTRLIKVPLNTTPTIPTDPVALYYVFFNPTGAPFFVILSDDGTEDFSISYNTDIVTQQRQSDGSYIYEVNNFPIEPKFWNSLESALAQRAKLISALVEETELSGQINEVYLVYNVTRFGASVYLIPLENEPREISNTVFDILLRDSDNPNTTAVISYEPTFGRYGLISGDTDDTIEWNTEYGVDIINRATITIAGSLIADAPSPEEPIIFTSFAAEQAPGDWSGIVFEDSSNSLEAPTRSIFRNCIVKYADVPFQILNSDPIIDQCLVKNFLSAGGISRSEPLPVVKYRTDDFLLVNGMFTLNTPQRIRTLGQEGIPSTFPVVTTTQPTYEQCGYGYGYGYDCGYGYGGCQGEPAVPSALVSNGYVSFPLQLRPLTAPEEGSGSQGIPQTTAVSSSRAVLTLAYGIDYTVFCDDVDITSKPIQTFADCSEIYLLPGVDFNIELNLNTFLPELVFYNTRNMQAFLFVYAQNPKPISISYSGVTNSGEITNSIFQNAINPAWIAESGSDLIFVNNTIYRTGPTALRIQSSYALLRNNIITEYSSAPIVKDPASVIFATRNNMFSSFILANEPHRPIDTDVLTRAMEIDEKVLPINSIRKYRSGLILKIDDEFMEILQVGIEVRVTRGAFDSIPARHDINSRIILLKKKTFFTVIGLDATNAQLLLTDSQGSILPTAQPINMLQVEPNTFRIAIPVDRENSVYYRYRYWKDIPSQAQVTPVAILQVEQFGDAVNDIFSTAFDSNIAVLNNYSADPHFVNEIGDNFTLLPTSPSSVDNPLFATPWNPSVVFNRFIGVIPRVENLFLTENTRIITLEHPLLAFTSLVDSIFIENATTKRRILPQNYNPETREITLVTPISLRNVGNYRVQYNSPTSLGSTLPGNPLLGTIQYQFDAKQNVEFTKFKALLDGDGGLVRFAYRISERKDLISNATFSDFIIVPREGELDLTAIDAEGAQGSIIEFIIELQGNDGSFDNTGEYLYPRLKNFTLSYSPSLDEEEYEVKEVRYINQSERTRVFIDPIGQEGVGITAATAARLGGLTEIVVNIRKPEMSNYLSLGRIRSLNVSDKFVDALGNFTIPRQAPSIDDLVEADFMYVSRRSTEVIPFTSASTQITSNRFVGISSITSDIVLDRVSQAPGAERLRIDITNQPRQGTGYDVSYAFEAPKNGETLIVNYTYNGLLQDVQSALDESKDALADVLAREMFGIDVTIGANIVVEEGFNPVEVVANVTRAIARSFTTFVAENPIGGGRIDATDTLSLIKNIIGVEDLVLTAHHRSGFAGVTNIQLSTREFPVLAPASPEIVLVSASAPNTALSVEN